MGDRVEGRRPIKSMTQIKERFETLFVFALSEITECNSRPTEILTKTI